MNTKIYLKIDGIDGKCTVQNFDNFFEIIEYQIGVHQSDLFKCRGTGGGAPTTRAAFKDLLVIKKIDSASPELTLTCANGTFIQKINLIIIADSNFRYEYILQDCIITSVDNVFRAENISDFPKEKIRFNYGSIEWIYNESTRSDLT